MEIVFVENGLGNQMSQYALYLRKKAAGSKKIKYVCSGHVHNGIELDQLFGIHLEGGIHKLWYLLLGHIMMTPKIPPVMNRIRKVMNFFGVSTFKENYDYSFHPEVLSVYKKGVRLIYGGWHHWRYFDGFKQQLNGVYSFPHFTNMKNYEIEALIKQRVAVAVHIRRGDYMNSKNFLKYGSVCSESYYRRAIEYVETKIKSPLYCVFSNDMEWAENLLRGKDAIFVNWNTGASSWQDMALMSKFSNIIIANSTFSWWAAWLGSEDKMVVCPPYLINGDERSNIFPNTWHHISDY